MIGHALRSLNLQSPILLPRPDPSNHPRDQNPKHDGESDPKQAFAEQDEEAGHGLLHFNL